MSNEKLEAVNDADKIILDEEEGDQETICCLSAEASKGKEPMNKRTFKEFFYFVMIYHDLHCGVSILGIQINLLYQNLT